MCTKNVLNGQKKANATGRENRHFPSLVIIALSAAEHADDRQKASSKLKVKTEKIILGRNCARNSESLKLNSKQIFP